MIADFPYTLSTDFFYLHFFTMMEEESSECPAVVVDGEASETVEIRALTINIWLVILTCILYVYYAVGHIIMVWLVILSCISSVSYVVIRFTCCFIEEILFIIFFLILSNSI